MGIRAIFLAMALVLGLGGANAIPIRADTRGPLDVRSVEIRNTCSSPVWLYYGGQPPRGPEYLVVLNELASTIMPMLEGDTVWLVRGDASVLGKARVTASTRAMIIDPTCTRIVARGR